MTLPVLLLAISYGFAIALLTVSGLHRGFLVATCLRRRRQSVPPIEPPATLPVVTVQLPLYNEAAVAARLIDACGALDYPHDRLQIQVLDDSTDETVAIARAAVAQLCAGGIDAVHVRRANRVGYKAGALAHGLGSARGELIAIFDADFVPPPGFLRAVVGHFADARVGCVQARWGHLNRERTLLTRAQALMLDGHHLVENRGRALRGHLFNFSGTGGIWRAAAIADAGGWQHDTLTEDLDLSYRAQLRGWRFVHRPDLVTPAELPEDMSAYRAQQFRWAKGTVQCARKLLGRIWRSPSLTRGQKIEATFHLTPHFAPPLVVLLSLLLPPLLIALPGNQLLALLLIDVPLAAASTGTLAVFYMYAEAAQGRSAWGALRRLPLLMAIGAGMSPWLTRAVVEGLLTMHGEFVRTPKRGAGRARYAAAVELPWLELGLAVISVLATVAAVTHGHYIAAPFAALFAFGYGYVACSLFAAPTTGARWRRRWGSSVMRRAPR